MTAQESARLAEIERAIISRRPEHSIDPTLGRIAALVNVLGDPHRAYPVIHLTGTNGKTSTARMTERLLRARGLRTGLFTSPHLTSIRERICIDGEPLSAGQFIAAYEELEPYLDLVDASQASPLSFFEVLVGMAFATFADTPVDVAVIEVGIGGFWDNTNVADGAVAVLTPISIDHVRWLGDTVEKIATEKSGIIKPGAVAVIGQQLPAVTQILLRRAADVGATVAREGQEFGVLRRELAVGGQRIDMRGLLGDYDDLFLPLFGAHQAGNLACAIAAVESFARADATDSSFSQNGSLGSEADLAGQARAALGLVPLDGPGQPAARGPVGVPGPGRGSPDQGAAARGPADPGAADHGTADGAAADGAGGQEGAQLNGVDHGGAELETGQLRDLARDDEELDDTGGTLGERDRSDTPGTAGQPGPLDLALVREAVAQMSSPGRLEVVRRSPVVIVDAAHNPAGMAATVAALSEAFSFEALIAVLSISADKDIAGILDELEPVATQIVATRNASGRAMDAEDLADAAQAVFGADRVTVAAHLDEAIEAAVGLADEADADSGGGPGGTLVLIAGSVITAGEARTLLTRGRRAAGRPASALARQLDGEPLDDLADDPAGDPS
jgi:folylpolyglutamate synthase/dihydropteroate synthase